MRIQILGGKAKGLPLFVPDNPLVRPTSVLLKRRFFDRYQDLSDFTFVDLCAGSGNIGLEAWSRGASAVILVEKSAEAVLAIKKNISSLKATNEVQVQREDVLSFLKRDHLARLLALHPDKEMVLYFDPPYEEHRLYEQVSNRIKELNLPALLVVESDRTKGYSEEKLHAIFGQPFKVYEHSDHYLALFQL